MLCKVLLTCFIWQLWCRSYSLISVWKLRTYKTFKPCHFYDYFDKAQSKLSIPKSLFPNVAFESVNRMTHDQFTSRQQNEGTVSFLRRYFPGNQPRDDGRRGGETSAWTTTCTCTCTLVETPSLLSFGVDQENWVDLWALLPVSSHRPRLLLFCGLNYRDGKCWNKHLKFQKSNEIHNHDPPIKQRHL